MDTHTYALTKLSLHLVYQSGYQQFRELEQSSQKQLKSGEAINIKFSLKRTA